MPKLKHILLVEDDPNDVELIITGLAENDLADKAIAVRDGEEALDYLNCSGRVGVMNVGEIRLHVRSNNLRSGRI